MRLASADAAPDFVFDVSDKTTHRLAGVVIASLFSALAWTGLLAAVGAAIDHPPGALLLVTVGAVIAGFLAAVLRALSGADGRVSHRRPHV
jgi:hypothetical protein